MNQAIKVGVFGTVCLVVLAMLVWRIEDIHPFSPGGRRISAIFSSVAGLDDKASVRVAGVRVGKVDGIKLAPDGRSADVSLLLDQPVSLTAGTHARIANMGLLGDKYVELVPGPPGAPQLPPGAALQGTTPVSFDEALAKLDNIGSSIQQMTGSLGGGDLGTNIQHLIADFQMTSAEIRALVAENRANVASTMQNFDAMSAVLAKEIPQISSQMQRALDQIASVVSENRGNVQASMGNIRDLTTHLQTSVDNLNHISGEIASGKGTIGKLVSSDEAYNHAVQTLDSIKSGVENLSGTLGAIQRFKIDLDLHGFLLGDQPNTFSHSQASFGLLIDPEDNRRLYKIDVASSPTGTVRDRIDRITTTHNDGTVTVRTTDDQTSENRLVWNALLGVHTENDIRFWGGIIESTGGVEVDYPLLSKRLWLSGQAFDFSRPNNMRAHLRFTTSYQFHPNLYVLGGYDDILQNRAIFFGAGIRWKDDNLKYLLGLAPKL